MMMAPWAYVAARLYALALIVPPRVGAGGPPAPDGQLAPFDFAEACLPTLPARVALRLHIDVFGIKPGRVNRA